jgi:hypothetical protein
LRGARGGRSLCRVLVIAISTIGAILIVVGCIALLALAGGLVASSSGRNAERVDPLGDRIETQDFKRPRNEGDLL